MSRIDTLVEDMKGTLELKKDPVHASLTMLGESVASHFKSYITPKEGVRTPNRIWFSQLGSNCYRKLWLDMYEGHLAEPLDASAKYKFMYGNVIEDITLELVKAAGHSVERCQEKIEVPIPGKEDWSISGRIDAIIDGHVIDVKSMSSYAYRDIERVLADTTGLVDKFGYKYQLSGYHAFIGDPHLAPALLCVDKQLGHIKLATDESPHSHATIIRRAESVISVVSDPTKRPPRRVLIEHGRNKGLDTQCGYCPYRKACWPTARTFLYAKKPVFLVEVNVEPKVPELKDEPKEEEDE